MVEAWLQALGCSVSGKPLVARWVIVEAVFGIHSFGYIIFYVVDKQERVCLADQIHSHKCTHFVSADLKHVVLFVLFPR